MPNAKLLKRLALLELRLAPECHNYIFICEEIPQNRQSSLAEGERIVLDGYRHNGAFMDARQRITTDPNDHGRQCEHGGYLLDVLQEVHAACCYREKPGHCNSCFGTPVAGT